MTPSYAQLKKIVSTPLDCIVFIPERGDRFVGGDGRRFNEIVPPQQVWKEWNTATSDAGLTNGGTQTQATDESVAKWLEESDKQIMEDPDYQLWERDIQRRILFLSEKRYTPTPLSRGKVYEFFRKEAKELYGDANYQSFIGTLSAESRRDYVAYLKSEDVIDKGQRFEITRVSRSWTGFTLTAWPRVTGVVNAGIRLVADAIYAPRGTNVVNLATVDVV